MRKSFPAEDLARDGRFRRAHMEDRFKDPRIRPDRHQQRPPGAASSPRRAPTPPTPPAR